MVVRRLVLLLVLASACTSFGAEDTSDAPSDSPPTDEHDAATADASNRDVLDAAPGVDAGPPPYLEGDAEAVATVLSGIRVIAKGNGENLLVGKNGPSQRIPLSPLGTPKSIGFDNARALCADGDALLYIRVDGEKNVVGRDNVVVSPFLDGQDILLGGGRMIAVFTGRVQSWLSRPELGGDTTHTPDDQGEPRGAATDGKHIFWADHRESAIYKAPLLEFDAQLFTTGARLFAAEEATSVVIDGPDLLFTTTSTIQRGPIVPSSSTGEDVTTLAKDLGHPLSLALDDAYVYWVEGDSGEFRRMDKKGGPIATFAKTKPFTDLTYNHLIVVDATHVYWAQPAENAIYRIEK